MYVPASGQLSMQGSAVKNVLEKPALLMYVFTVAWLILKVWTFAYSPLKVILFSFFFFTIHKYKEILLPSSVLKRRTLF